LNAERANTRAARERSVGQEKQLTHKSKAPEKAIRERAHALERLRDTRNDHHNLVSQSQELKGKHNEVSKELKALQRKQSQWNAEQLEKTLLECERLKTERKKYEAIAAQEKESLKLHEIEAQETSKKSMARYNADLRLEAEREKKRNRELSAKKKSHDDTHKFGESVAMFHSSLQAAQGAGLPNFGTYMGPRQAQEASKNSICVDSQTTSTRSGCPLCV
jgi:hypothetical protein